MCLIGNKNGQKYSMYDIKVLITFDNEQKKVKKSFFIYILEKLKLLILLAPWQGKRNWFVLTRLLCFIPCTKISKTLRICRTKDYSFSLLFHQRAIFFITWTKIWNTKKTNTIDLLITSTHVLWYFVTKIVLNYCEKKLF